MNLRGATCFWFWRHFYAGWPHACVQWAALRITWPELPETSASFAHTWWCWSRRCGSQTHPGLDVNSAVRPETQELLFTTLSIVSWIFWMQDKVNTSPSVRYIRTVLFTGEVSFSYNQLCVCARARVLRYQSVRPCLSFVLVGLLVCLFIHSLCACFWGIGFSSFNL